MSAHEPSGRAEGEATWIQTIGIVLGVVGATASAFGIVLYLLEPRLLPLSAANVLLGAVGVAGYAISNRSEVGRVFPGAVDLPPRARGRAGLRGPRALDRRELLGSADPRGVGPDERRAVHAAPAVP
ncbi:MAG: hypothetical protein HC923_12705 [Myxococcales bacterium]|nr:hypothetical protein [Myxococcales bacterium]